MKHRSRRRDRILAILALSITFIWFMLVLMEASRSRIPGIGLPLIHLLPVATMLMLTFWYRKHKRHPGYGGAAIWATLAVAMMLIWLVLAAAQVSLPILSGPMVHLLPVGAVLLMVFRYRIPMV